MTSALFAALSGLKAHESWIDVIGNNLANSSTPGYKSSRAIFSDQFSQTLRFATLPSGTNGGMNPMQLGLGTQLAEIGRNMDQGALTNTGRTFDLALQGRGHFMVTDGTNTLYTRVGTFGLDGTSNLVDQRTGYRVLGVDGAPIALDTTSMFAPQATSSVSFGGNLPAVVTGPLPQILTTTQGFKNGTPASLSGANAGPYTVPVNETWSMDLSINSAAPLTVQVTSTTGTITAGDIVNAINALPSSGVTAAVAGNGSVQITTDRTGAQTNIKVSAGPAGRDLAAATGLSTTLVSGAETTGNAATLLNDLPTNMVDYQAGDTIEISGTDQDGSPVSASFVFGTGVGQNGETVGDLMTFIDTAYGNATASLDPTTGQMLLTADQTGVTGMTLTIMDGTAATGATTWSQHALLATTVGTGPDTVQSSIEVFDSVGTSHTVNFTYERQDDGSWDILASIPPSEGTITGAVQGLTFGTNGTITSLPTVSNLSITFTGQTSQSLLLDVGTPGLYDGLTQFGGAATLIADAQDGYGAGDLSSIAVNGDGDIQGFYSNGQIRSLGDIGVATFVNDGGLREIGNNLWAETANSGVRTVSAGAQAQAGEVVGGSLEGSNVEIAEEFVRLIEAQRGFQANARVITTTDQVLSELVNLLR